MLVSAKRDGNFYFTTMFEKTFFYSGIINKFENLKYIENIK